MDAWWWIAALVAAAALGWWAWRRRRGAGTDAIRSVLAAHGAARCLAACALLRQVAGAGQPAIAEAIDAIELPLVQALPDCPPTAKPELTDALDACAAAVANRALAKRIMALRNALVG